MSKTKNLAKNLPRNIIEIVSRYVDKKIGFFPGFYWLWNQQRYRNNRSRIEDKFKDCDPRLAWFGVVPKGLKEALKEIGMNERQIQGCIEDIMTEIMERLVERWKRRCCVLFSNT